MEFPPADFILNDLYAIKKGRVTDGYNTAHPFSKNEISRDTLYCSSQLFLLLAAQWLQSRDPLFFLGRWKIIIVQNCAELLFVFKARQWVHSSVI
ncbi:MAG: hypothetical protein D3925_14365 [Candidatus Electrothrix sp. AR5]|nr:hypothetical protein [Candidatus Electrothrix sp. AR5]